MTGDLRGDNIVGDAVGDLGGIKSAGQELEQVVVDSVEIFTVLARVVEARAGDLWKLTRSVEAAWGEWIRRRCVDVPADLCRSAVWIRNSIVEESFVIAIPWIGFVWKRVRCIWGTLVVSMDLLKG